MATYEPTQKQLDAVKSAAQQTMVIAGPGTGKTHILTSRIEYLIKNYKINPQNILALTFSDSAKNSMKQRAVSFLGVDAYKLEINTFHGFASSLLDEYPDIFGYKHNLKNVADIDRAKIIRNILNEMDKNSELKELRTKEELYFYYQEIANAISVLKKEGYSVNNFKEIIQKWQKNFDDIDDKEKFSTVSSRIGKLKQKFEDELKQINKNKELVIIYEHYQQKLKEYNYYDYEDMILQAIEGLEKSEYLREKIHQQFSAILVDEYQDTSGAQNKLLFLIAEPKTNLFIVGDDDQAIYRFQGASIENFIEFIEKYPKAKIISLKDNFRSPQFLLDAALHIANKNTQRITQRLNLPDKILEAHGESKNSDKIFFHKFDTDIEEHAFLLEKIQELKKVGVSCGDIAIIMRTNKEQKEIGELLTQAGIPVALSSEQNSLKEPHIVSLLAMAKSCINPNDSENLVSFLLHPATPIEARDVWTILADRKKKESVYLALKRNLQNNKLHDLQAAQKTFEIVNELSSLAQVKSGAHWVYELIQKSGFMQWLLKQNDWLYLISHIRAFTDEAKRIQEGNPSLKVKEILEHFEAHNELDIPLKPKIKKNAFENAVQIMTAHQVKGQEYDHVFIIHAVEGNWSGKRVPQRIKLPVEIPTQEHNTEDERRIFYVALTRARKSAHISYANLYIDTENREKQTHPASFLIELEEKLQAKYLKKDVRDVLIKSISSISVANEAQKEIIKNIVTSPSFHLNATSLNTFFECPQMFLYEKVLGIPKIKTFSLEYGSAIHLALQKHFETNEKERGLDNLIKWLDWYIKIKTSLTEKVNARLRKTAEHVLKDYWNKKLQNEKNPLYVEYKFKTQFENVQLSGKIDKISISDPSLHKSLADIAGSDPAMSATNTGTKVETVEKVKIVDYKTGSSKTKNAILGKTKDDFATRLGQQLTFYKILIDNDAQFNYEPKEFVLDFIEDVKDVSIEISPEMQRDFEEKLKKAWNQIQTLEFLEMRCGKCKYCELTNWS